MRLTDVNLDNVNLFNADLAESALIGAKLTGAKLSGTNLESANLTGADLKSAWLFDVNLHLYTKLVGTLYTRDLIIFDGTSPRDGVILMTVGGKFRMAVRTYR